LTLFEGLTDISFFDITFVGSDGTTLVGSDGTTLVGWTVSGTHRGNKLFTKGIFN
jgi:hypothetical protein